MADAPTVPSEKQTRSQDDSSERIALDDDDLSPVDLPLPAGPAWPLWVYELDPLGPLPVPLD